MEKRDLYDENKELTGKTIYKNEEIPEGYFILMVVAFIENNEGLFLIQKRSAIKGGEWAFTGGHPKSGENSKEGLYTEIKEELGIDAINPILFKEAKGKNTFCYLYYLKQDIKLEDIIKQDEEVEEVVYASKEEIEDLFNKGLFKKGHYMMFMDLLKYKGK